MRRLDVLSGGKNFAGHWQYGIHLWCIS